MRFLFLTLVLVNLGFMTSAQSKPDRTILAAGSGGTAWTHPAFLRYLIGLTKKPNPKIAFVPTASGDNPTTILNWYAACESLPMRPFVVKTFIASAPGQRSFEEQILDMDAIVVGGGNTLNMIAIWKAQGIDTVLRNAYERGIIMAGGSAGSLCWFQGGYSDSRPKNLTIVNGLGYLPWSHCPHYHSEPGRKPLYFQAILDGKLANGYACDNEAAVLFINEKWVKSVSTSKDQNSYYIHLQNGKVVEDLLPSEIIR